MTQTWITVDPDEIGVNGTELLKGESDQGVRDAGLIAAAQRVEHNEMAGYSSARRRRYFFM